MKKLFASKEVKKAIMKKMSKSQRKWMKEGEIFSIRIVRFGRPMKRWGDDDNTAKIAVGGKSCRIYRNNLVDLAWNYDPENAAVEAARALDYFVYGDKDDFDVVIC